MVTRLKRGKYKRGLFGKTRIIRFAVRKRIDVKTGRFSPPRRRKR